MQGIPNNNEPPINSLYWNLWKMGLTPLNQMQNTQFYAALQSNTYQSNAIYTYNMNDFYLVYTIRNRVEEAQAIAEKSPHPSLEYALFTLNAELTKRMSDYQTVWHLQDGVWAPMTVVVDYEKFMFQTLQDKGVFYFLCTVLARLTVWGIIPGIVQPTNAGYTTWLNWKNSQTLSYGIGNQMDDYATNNPTSYDIHTALDLYGNSLNYEADLMAEVL